MKTLYRSLTITSLLFFLYSFGHADVSQKTTELSKLYETRLKDATEELTRAKEEILREKEPIFQEVRELETSVSSLEAELTTLKTAHAEHENKIALYNSENLAIRKNLNYSAMLAEEAVTTLEASLQAGEEKAYRETILKLHAALGNAEARNREQQTMDAIDLLVDRIEQQIGGHSLSGESLLRGDNRVRDGQFLYFGPFVYFRDDKSGTIGLPKQKDDSEFSVVYPLVGLSEGSINPLFEGKKGIIPIDVTGGKAHQLKEAKGSLLDHFKKGGPVGFVIACLGLFALVTGLMKLWDIRKLSVDQPGTVKQKLDAIEVSNHTIDASQFSGLRRSVRDLFAIGIRHVGKSRELLEEMLYAQVLLLRYHHERRLPMLRVIAAAAPLLGLLGTVVGMIKTFTLITVFGTGNASKLSSGISEALVTTEMGLIVAIPTLVIYGYLAQQTERRLSLLEKYSTDFVNAVEWIDGDLAAPETADNQ